MQILYDAMVYILKKSLFFWIYSEEEKQGQEITRQLLQRPLCLCLRPRLFQQPKSGILSVEKVELEKHLQETYSRPQTDSTLNIPGIQVPPAPFKQLSQQPLTLDEMQKAVKNARAKSAPGPNGIPYLP